MIMRSRRIPGHAGRYDSHTTMINDWVYCLGSWWNRSQANMLGQPLYMLMPEVVGMELVGQLSPGATATDLCSRVTEILRKEGVVNKFVEFFGEGIARMTLADRATIANMAPSTEQPWDSSQSTTRRFVSFAVPVAMKRWCSWSSDTAKSKAFSTVRDKALCNSPRP